MTYSVSRICKHLFLTKFEPAWSLKAINNLCPLTLLWSVNRYTANAKQYFDDYLPGPNRTVFHTKKGLSWRNAWGVLRYSANNAFVAFVLADQQQKQASLSTMNLSQEEQRVDCLQLALFSSSRRGNEMLILSAAPDIPGNTSPAGS